MFNNYIKYSQDLIEQGSPFVVAIVVNYQGPISGKPGDRAIVTNDGQIWGWVAGGCSRSIIIEEALHVLKTNRPKMIKITPDPMESNDNIEEYKMTCHSGGTLEVFLEPIVPKPLLIILGNSMVGQKLATLANTLDYEVSDEIADKKTKRLTNIVVATQGDGDESALEQALSIAFDYLGFVASKKKGDAVKETLSKRGISEDRLDAIKAPAGIDIKARSPEEIAISILAEIIMTNRIRISKKSPAPVVDTAVDSICKMTVKIDGAKHVYDHQGTSFYFCCEGCKTIFESDPEKYLVIND